MAHAQAVALPVTPLSLSSARAKQVFVAAAIAAQRGATVISAPYFQYECIGDAWHKLNADLVAETLQQVSDREVVAFAQVPLERLVSGDLAGAALTFAELGISRVFLRVAGFDPVAADQTEARAYRDAVDAFLANGLEPVPDCVGRFGLVLTSAGAGGFSSGSRHHQRIARHPVYLTEEMTSDPCRYEVPERWFAMLRAVAVQAAQHGTIPPCPVQPCGALAGTRPRDLKAHYIHYNVDRVRLVAAGGTAVVRGSLIGFPQTPYTQAWLAAV